MATLKQVFINSTGNDKIDKASYGKSSRHSLKITPECITMVIIYGLRDYCILPAILITSSCRSMRAENGLA